MKAMLNEISWFRKKPSGQDPHCYLQLVKRFTIYKELLPGKLEISTYQKW